MTNSPSKQIHPYLRVAADLREKIHTRQLVPGDELPTIAELARAHGVAPATAHKAVEVLEQAGQVRTSQGTRSTVAAQPVIVRNASTRYKATDGLPHEREVGEQGLRPLVLYRDVSWIVPSAEVAAKLGAALDEKVVVRGHVLVVENDTVGLSDSSYRFAVAKDTILTEDHNIPQGTHAYLRELGHRLGYFDEALRVRAATGYEYEALRCKSVVAITRTLSDHNGAVLQVTQQRFIPERYVFVTRVPAQ